MGLGAQANRGGICRQYCDPIGRREERREGGKGEGDSARTSSGRAHSFFAFEPGSNARKLWSTEWFEVRPAPLHLAPP